MPGDALSQFGMDARLGQVRDEHVAVGVEIGVQAIFVLILEIVGLFTLLSLLIALGFLNPDRPGSFQVELHHCCRLAESPTFRL